MHLLRVIFAILLTSAFPLAANECLLAAAFPAAVADCCGGHSEPADAGAVNHDCANCAMMGIGFNPATVAAFAAGAVEWRENVLLSAHLRAALAVVEKDAPSVVPKSPPEVRSLWPSLVRTALPVRGPSFA